MDELEFVTFRAHPEVLDYVHYVRLDFTNMEFCMVDGSYSNVNSDLTGTFTISENKIKFYFSEINEEKEVSFLLKKEELFWFDGLTHMKSKYTCIFNTSPFLINTKREYSIFNASVDVDYYPTTFYGEFDIL